MEGRENWAGGGGGPGGILGPPHSAYTISSGRTGEKVRATLFDAQKTPWKGRKNAKNGPNTETVTPIEIKTQ